MAYNIIEHSKDCKLWSGAIPIQNTRTTIIRKPPQNAHFNWIKVVAKGVTMGKTFKPWAKLQPKYVWKVRIWTLNSTRWIRLL